MNKKLAAWLITAAMISTVSLSVYGDTLPENNTTNAVNTTVSATAASEQTQETFALTATNAEENKKKAGITPDSILYPVERLIESVQVNLTFYADGKADLLVKFANERLAEASVMNEKNKMELVEKMLKVYTETVQEANKSLEEAAKADKDINATLDEIKVMENEAGQIVIKITGVIPKEIEEELKTAMVTEVKKTLAIKSFAAAKESLNDAKKAFELAKEELKQAEKSGDQTKIANAKEKLAQAEANKEQLEKIKDEIEEYKEEIKKLLENKKEESETDKKDEQKPEITPTPTQAPEKMNDKVEKIEKQIEKLQGKRQEIIEHVSDKPGKAAEKIRENTEKQIEKKQEKIEKFKEKAEEKKEKSEKGKGKKD